MSGTSLADRFTLDAFVARGGYGAVYRGTHLALGCPVAVKILVVPEQYEGRARARFVAAFEREARTVAALRHPAIVRVHDFGVTGAGDDAHPYMVLEWIDGATLEATLRAHGGGRPPREALALLRPVLDAIASAHEAGVVHRDLKPANVMVTSARRGEVSTRVLDFGVAKMFAPDEGAPDGSAHTGDDLAAFSLSHAAPEQVGRLRTGPWTDVHALALLLVEVLTGERAYRGETSADLFARVTSPERPTPRAFSRDAGPWEPVLARALSLSPAARHPDAAALLADLEASVDGAQRAWASPVPTADLPAEAPRGRSHRAAWPLALAAVVCVVAATAWARRTGRSPAAPVDRRTPPAAPPAAVPARVAAAPAATASSRPEADSPSPVRPSARAHKIARAAAAPRPAPPRAVAGGATADGEIEIE